MLNINYEDPMHYVNYANLLSFRFGRNYESIEFYDKALAIDPNFPLALANKGETLYYLAGFNDINTTNVIIIDSHFFIKRALDIGMEAGATKHYQEIIAKITEKYQWLREYKYSPCHKSFEVFKNPFKNFHINFCHKNRLFLNPLTIEHTCPAALHDPLKMGDIAINNSVHDNSHRFQEYLNRLKQEYVFARYLTVQSFYKSKDLSFIDNDNALVDSYSDTINNIYIEHARVAYRVAFSLLDKIALFVNEYYQLGLAPNKIYFGSLSIKKYIAGKNNKYITPKLISLCPIQNPFLAAIIDLANDFEGEYFSDIREMRRKLEHRFFNIYRFERNGKMSLESFNSILLQLLYLIKSTIFYIVQMIDYEESKKSFKKR